MSQLPYFFFGKQFLTQRSITLIRSPGRNRRSNASLGRGLHWTLPVPHAGIPPVGAALRDFLVRNKSHMGSIHMATFPAYLDGSVRRIHSIHHTTSPLALNLIHRICRVSNGALEFVRALSRWLLWRCSSSFAEFSRFPWVSSGAALPTRPSSKDEPQEGS